MRDFYYPDSTRRTKGSYLDEHLRIKQGIFTSYYIDGQTSSEGRYEQNKKEGVWRSWWRQGGRLDYETPYRNGELHGTCRWYHANGEISEESVYENGLLVSALFRDSTGRQQADGSAEERMPSFTGGQSAYYAYLTKNLRYPKSARRAGQHGKVVVQFIVEPAGDISRASIYQSTGSAILDEEALRVIRAMLAWTPGANHNCFVSSVFRQALTFKTDN